MSIYKQLTREERYQIKALLKTGHNRAEITRTIGVHPTTIKREIECNRGQRGYRPEQAHRTAMVRRKDKSRSRISSEVWLLVNEKLREDWSPEQISGRLRQDNLHISHECIYQHIYADKQAGGTLWTHLRRHPKKYRKRAGGRDRRGKIPNRRCIEERPFIVEERSRIGDWKADLILGANQQGVALTLTERKSRLTLLRTLVRKHAQPIRDEIVAFIAQMGCAHQNDHF